MRDKITVILIDDQAIMGAKIRRMLASESDIIFHYCSAPTSALKMVKSCQQTVSDPIFGYAESDHLSKCATDEVRNFFNLSDS